MVKESIFKDLVLLGGGHSHVIALKMLCMSPIKHLRITLVSDQVYAPYSGMLPGHLAGWYDFDQCHFDLVKMCAQLGVRFIHSEAIRVNLNEKEVLLKDHPNLAYDILSVNVGSRPDLAEFSKQEDVLALKPISEFLKHWKEFLARLQSDHPPKSIAMIGGGATGVEIAFIIQKWIKQFKLKTEIHLFEKSAHLLPGHNASVRSFIKAQLKKKDIRVHLNESAKDFDIAFLATRAAAPKWFRESGLPVSENGFLKTESTLKVNGMTDIFAAGDCISFADKNLPKSGVYAVRQGKILGKNLRRSVLGNKNLIHYRPQKRALALITTGEKYAVASRGWLFLKGQWLWKIKNKIDHKFMERFKNLPIMSDEEPTEHLNVCGGCGAKVTSDILNETINGLSSFNDEVLIGLSQPDDASVSFAPEGKLLVSTVDGFRSFTEDLYLFGRISTLHALNDIYAMGATPSLVQCLVTLPSAPHGIIKRDFKQVMSGISQALGLEGVTLTGGHSVEGAEASIGIAAQGWVDEKKIWRKKGAEPGDVFLLTKPIGTGALLAAAMKGKAQGQWIESLNKYLLQSQRDAFSILRKFDIHATTDVTGFGLGGHLAEMCAADRLSVELFLNQIPVLDGFKEVISQGIEASISSANAEKVISLIKTSDSWALSVLSDPQTNGGLLVALPKDQADRALTELHQAGYEKAAIIAEVAQPNSSANISR